MLKASNLGAGELGVFHIPSILVEDASREFPYSSQTMKNQTRVSVKFNTEQVVFDAPPTLEVSYSNATRCVIVLNFSIIRIALLLPLLPFLKPCMTMLAVGRDLGVSM